MPRAASLEPTEREFCQRIAAAAFANPFSDQRHELDLQIAGHFHGEPERVERLRTSVGDLVQKLERENKAHLAVYNGEDRRVMEIVFLFEIFHRFYRQFDELITQQVNAGDRPLVVEFAGDVLGLMARRGFDAQMSLRYLAVFYQLRRGFYFIMGGLTGLSPCMKELRKHLWNNVFTHDIRVYDSHLRDRMEDFSTVLLGETGTGKGTAAAAIGRSAFIPFDEKKNCFAESFTRAFVSLNLSQFPETLIESELFGHKRGAFTGAIQAHEGVFARCSRYGAIFLDEIGDVSVPVQIKLLQVLQDRTFSPVGGREKLHFRGRVIAATNRSLPELRARKLFRDDFFYRLCSDVITVPPLRQRIAESRNELDLLIEQLIERMTGGPSPELAALVRTVFDESLERDYPWPGNVRELEQAVRRILLTRSFSGETRTNRDRSEIIAASLENGSMKADELLAAYCALLYERYGSFEEVARRTDLDRRTVKRYLQMGRGVAPDECNIQG